MKRPKWECVSCHKFNAKWHIPEGRVCGFCRNYYARLRKWRLENGYEPRRAGAGEAAYEYWAPVVLPRD